MTKQIIVKVMDGKENTVDETRIYYLTGVPEDIIFFDINGTTYAQWWNRETPARLVKVPVYQLVSID